MEEWRKPEYIYLESEHFDLKKKKKNQLTTNQLIVAALTMTNIFVYLLANNTW